MYTTTQTSNQHNSDVFRNWLICISFDNIMTTRLLIAVCLFAAVIHAVTLVSGQQQYFRIQPKDVQIHEGGDITMECEVANLAGAVQWTKDGFALGRS